MSRVAKRGIDIVVASVAIVISAPIALAIAAGILYTMGRPVLFRQVRPGLRGQPFVLLKFRSMLPAENGVGEEDFDTRLTPFGRWLRKSSLDELPQLINVLKGDLSLVGPRPLLVEYLPLYNAEQARRHDMRPGLTGWAQIHGRSCMKMEERFKYDIWYVDHWSIGLDFRIIAKTVAYVACRKGIGGNGAPTEPVWAGNATLATPSTVAADICGTGRREARVGRPGDADARRVTRSPRLVRALAAPMIDAIVWAIALSMATWFRYDWNTAPINVANLASLVTVAVLVQWALGTALGTYRGRYYVGSVGQACNLATVALAVGLILFVYQLLLPNDRFVPRSVPLAAVFIMFVFASGARLVVRAARTCSTRAGRPPATQGVIIFGAGEAGCALVRALRAEPASAYRPVALLDDDPCLRRRRIAGVRVRGNRFDLADVAASTGAELLVLAVHNADPADIREVTRAAVAAGLAVKRIPSVLELLRPGAGMADLREVNVADLLGRPAVSTDVEAVAGYLSGKRVLVTGAGGSIGSELCRQIERFKPARLVMLDRDESALHAVQLSISGAALMDSEDLVLADIRDRRAISEVFSRQRPEVVFHAAALKHLPMLEKHPSEAWKTNVLGTMNVLDSALLYHVERLVNVSTDKAANPISVLGRSKRVGERLVAGVVGRSPTQRYLSVRFGNVLGSRGSVLTTFADQIAAGRSVTITHPEMTRYFMTVPEAVELVIQAGAIGGSGDVLVLDMGVPVRIIDVAHQMMQMAGRSCAIVYTGLRRGEKLHEDLFGAGETDVRPVHPAIAQVRVPPLSAVEISGLAGIADPVAAMLSLTRIPEHAGAGSDLLGRTATRGRLSSDEGARR